MLRSRPRQLAAMITVFACNAPAVVVAELDAPSLALVRSDRSSITVQVTAGASGAPAGLAMDWMRRADDDALGGWPASSYNPALHYCDFDGVPTLTMTPGTASYLLGPGQSVTIEVGDLFDETGMYGTYLDELPAATEFVLRVHAEATQTETESPYSATVFAGTTPPPQGCTLTQGFWKNHEEVWPVLDLMLGNVNYTQAQLLDILNTPAQGNGLIFLAHQLISTKLNLANGAPAGPIAATVAAADALIDGLVVPPVGAGFLAPADASGLTQSLDDYNNGALGVPDCDAVPADATRWGVLKSLYRD